MHAELITARCFVSKQRQVLVQIGIFSSLVGAGLTRIAKSL
jgi:hypothetical protein